MAFPCLGVQHMPRGQDGDVGTGMARRRPGKSIAARYLASSLVSVTVERYNDVRIDQPVRMSGSGGGLERCRDGSTQRSLHGFGP